MEGFRSERWTDEAAPSHRNSIKSPVGNSAGNRRKKLAVQIGKDRRDSLLRGKRFRRDDPAENGEADILIDEDDIALALEAKTLTAVQELKASQQAIGRDAVRKKINALQKVRRLLSSSSKPPLKTAVDAGVVNLLVESLQFGSPEEQILEAAWCLTNIASGEQELTKAILPALPMLIYHLGEISPTPVAEQCAWALGNVAGESEEMRDILLAQGALPALGRLMGSTVSSLARTAAWAMSNLIKGPSSKAALDLMNIEGMPKHLVHLVLDGDEELVVEVVWVLVYITSMSDTHSGVLVKLGVFPPLVTRLCTSDQLRVLTPVLRCIGNIVAGDNSKTDAVLAVSSNIPGGVNTGLQRCLDMGQHALQKEAAWVVSNIAAGTMLHKQFIFQGGIIPSLLHLLATAAFDVRKEVAFALGNVCVSPRANGKEIQPIVAHLTVLVDRGCIPGFLALVKSPDMEASKLGLQFTELILRGLPDHQGPRVVEKEDGIAAMEFLQFHENEELRNMANGLIDTYFGEDYGLEEEYGSEVVSMIRGSGDGASDYPPWRTGGIANG